MKHKKIGCKGGIFKAIVYQHPSKTKKSLGLRENGVEQGTLILDDGRKYRVVIDAPDSACDELVKKHVREA